MRTHLGHVYGLIRVSFDFDLVPSTTFFAPDSLEDSFCISCPNGWGFE